MRPYDELILLGVLARWPERRYSLAHVEPRFFRESWQAIAWRTLWNLHDEDEAADLARPVRLDRLLDRAPPLQAQSRALATAIADGDTNAFEAEAAADRLVARWQSARLADAARTILAHHDQGDLDGEPRRALDAMASEWSAAELDVATAEAVQAVYSPEQLAEQTAEVLQRRRDDPDSALGALSGWRAWDRVHKGARPGRCGFTISPTGTGKTSFMLNLAARICDGSSGVPGLYINLEMTAEDIVTRLAAIRLHGEQTLDALESGAVPHLVPERAADLARSSQLHVTAPTEKTAGAISALLARYAVRYGIKWACVDHLLEVSQSDREARDTQGAAWRCHTSWVRRWHLLAQRFGFALEVVGQCGSQDLSFQAGHEPSFRNMQGARAVLNHVDVARILWRDDDCHAVAIRKNRGGIAPFGIAFRFVAPKGVWHELGRREA